MDKYVYSEADLISFGEYCLSDIRLERMKETGHPQSLIYHGDFMSWLKDHREDIFIQMVRNEKIDIIIGGPDII